jgi:hypothetical protein
LGSEFPFPDSSRQAGDQKITQLSQGRALACLPQTSAGFFLGSPLDPEGEGNKFIRNSGLYPNYATSNTDYIAVFIVTAMSTSNPTNAYLIQKR